MMKSVRLFNANTLFKVSLIMIVMVAAIYVIGLSLIHISEPTRP